MIRSILVISCVFVLLQCHQDERKHIHQADLLGEWELISDKAPSLPYIGHSSNRSLLGPGDGHRLVFHADNTVETGEVQAAMLHHPVVLSYASPYHIEDDSLVLFNLESRRWNETPIAEPAARIKIQKAEQDTLTFTTGNNESIRYRRAAPLPDSLPTFDAIVVATTGCFGKCPITFTIIRPNGTLLYFGKHFVDTAGFFTATLPPQEYATIQDLFRRADIKNIATDFESKTQNLEEVTITFVKDGKIYKTIRDYGGVAPAALIWAYVRLRHLHTFAKLTKFPTDAPLTEHLSIGSFLQGTALRYRLRMSECFLLWNYLIAGKPSRPAAHAAYDLEFTLSHSWPIAEFGEPLPIKSIKTDGQRYTFNVPNRESSTIDIGFNFITKNLHIFTRRQPKD